MPCVAHGEEQPMPARVLDLAVLAVVGYALGKAGYTRKGPA